MEYAVITFRDRDQNGEILVSEVPASWLTEDCTKCYWPPVKNVYQYMEKRCQPTLEWALYDVTVDGYFPTLFAAREKAATISESEDSCNPSTTNQLRSRKRKPKRSFSPSQNDACNDSSEDNYREITPPPKLSSTNKEFPLKKSNKSTINHLPVNNYSPSSCRDSSSHNNNKCYTYNNTSNFNNPTPYLNVSTSNCSYLNNNNYTQSKDGPQNLASVTIEPTLTPLATFSCNKQRPDAPDRPPQWFTTFQASNSNLLTTILAEVRSISQRLNRAPVNNHVNLQETEVFGKLPIDTKEVFDDVTMLIQNEPHKSNLLNIIKEVGGESSRENVYRVLKKIFTDKLANQCTWKGTKTKFKLEGEKIVELIYRGVNLCNSLKQKEFEKYLSDFLRHAKQRMERGAQLNNNGSKDSDNEDNNQ